MIDLRASSVYVSFYVYSILRLISGLMSKKKKDVVYTQLSPENISSSKEIQEWLHQFSVSDRSIATTALSRLKFISRDEYAYWIKSVLSELPNDDFHAIYAVRKFDEEEACYWNAEGKAIFRPAASQGSEDLVYSLISNAVRNSDTHFLDHPSLDELRSNKVRNLVLIDDSIGSGKRVSDFLRRMFQSPTLLSWWNLGWIKLTIIAFSRPRDSEEYIISRVPGGNHFRRKIRKSEKIDFISEIVFNKDWLEDRWGEKYREIVSICSQNKRVSKWARLGFGSVMANIVFYHSVPNNIPGILWFTEMNGRWNPIFKNRAIPDWLENILDGTGVLKDQSSTSKEVIRLLAIIKNGVRSLVSIANRLNVDNKYAENLVRQAIGLGLLSENRRLTSVGYDVLMKEKNSQEVESWDYSLYTPTSWSTGQG